MTPEYFELEERVSPLALANVLLRSRRLLVAIPAGAVALAVLFTLLSEVEHISSSTLMPQAPQSSASRLTGLAAQFGVNLGGSSSGQPVQFYAQLLTSRELLRQAVLTEYQLPGDQTGEPRTGNLIELMQVEGETPEQRLRAAINRLRERISVRTELETGLIQLRVSSLDRELTTRVNRRLLDLLNEFNLERRQSQARAEREFVEERMREAQRELQTAEAALERFLERNRRYQDSPQLSFEAARLQRQVDLRQQLYGSLADSYEQARIEEVRNTPVITVIDPPEGSIEERRPSLLLFVLLAAILGTVIAITVAFGRHALERQRSEFPDEYEEFRELRRSIIRDLSPRRILARVPVAQNGQSSGPVDGE